MTIYLYIAVALLYLVLILAYRNLILHERQHLAGVTMQRLRWQYVHERQRANAIQASRDKVRVQLDDAWSTCQTVQDLYADTYRRNVWLERKRYVILRMWWRRRAYRSLVVAWKIGRGV